MNCLATPEHDHASRATASLVSLGAPPSGCPLCELEQLALQLSPVGTPHAPRKPLLQTLLRQHHGRGLSTCTCGMVPGETPGRARGLPETPPVRFPATDDGTSWDGVSVPEAQVRIAGFALLGLAVCLFSALVAACVGGAPWAS